MTDRRFTAAAVQLCSTDDVPANLEACRAAVAEAAGRGAALVVLPECFAFLGRRERDRFAHAEDLDAAEAGPIRQTLVELARRHQVWLIAGGLPERLADERGPDRAVTRTFNTCLVVSPEGELRERYQKIHLFDIDIPGGAVLRESDTTAGGTDVVTAHTPLARIGLSICYDVRFPELYRRQVVEHGAELLVVPAAFTAHTGKAHWHTLLRARAIENQCYVVAAAQSGRHNDKRESYGHSLIIDPWGTILAELPEGTGVITAEIDPAHLATTRQQLPCLTHRRL